MAENAVQAARAAFERRDWSTARAEFERCRAAGDLAIDDLLAMRRAAWWLGDGPTSMSLAEHAYRRLVTEGAPREAATVALDLTLEWVDVGEVRLAAGRLNRARRALDGLPPCSSHGYLAYGNAMLSLETTGRTDQAIAAAPRLRGP